MIKPLLSIIVLTLSFATHAEVLRVMTPNALLKFLKIENTVSAVRTNTTYNSDSMAITVSYMIPNIYVTPDTTLYPDTYFWNLDGCGISTTPATPSFPHKTDLFVLPGDATNITLRIDNEQYTTFNTYTPTPARCLLPPGGSEFHTIENVPAISDITKTHPPVYIDAITRHRDKIIVYVSFQPCSYHKKLNNTRICHSLTYSILFESDQLHTDSDTSTHSFPSGLDFTMDCKPNVVLCPENYLILTYEKYSDALLPFIKWKKSCGSEVNVVFGDNWASSADIIEDRNLKRAAIKKAIKDAYDSDKDLMYIVFAGSSNELPGEISQYWTKSIGSPSLYANPQTDYYYQCVDGMDDLEPDLISGRFMASTPEDMRTIVNKIIKYEKTPTQEASFYDHVLHLAYFQDGPNYDNKIKIDGIEDMSCVHTSEYLRESAIMNGKNVTRIYTCSPNTGINPTYMKSAVLGPNQLLPEEVRIGYNWYSSPEMITSNLNSGRLYTFYGGHGDWNGWTDPTYKIPFENLANSTYLPVIFSGACDTGRFSDGAFAPRMLTAQDGGAVAVIAAERSHYDPIEFRMFRGMFNEFWPRDYETNIQWQSIKPGGGLSGNVTQSTPFSSYSRKESDVERITLGKSLSKGHWFSTVFTSAHADTNNMICREVYHLFGDPGMIFHTDNPQIMHDVQFEIKTTPPIYKYFVLTLDEPALIGYYNETSGLIGRYYGSCMGRLSSTNSIYHITIQRHNHVPFTILYRNGFIFTSAPLANSDQKSEMSILQSEPGLVKIAYHIPEEMISDHLIEIRDFNNTLIASERCNDPAGEITLRSPKITQGYYVVSLSANGQEPLHIKTIIH